MGFHAVGQQLSPITSKCTTLAATIDGEDLGAVQQAVENGSGGGNVAYSHDPRVAESNACRMMENDGVKARIAELRKPQTEAALLTKERKREILRRIVEDDTRNLQDRLRAMAEDSKLAGHYEPEKQQIDHRVSNLDEIRKRAREARSPFALPVMGVVSTRTSGL